MRKLLKQLLAEREALTRAIQALDDYQRCKPRGRGRPPKRLV